MKIINNTYGHKGAFQMMKGYDASSFSKNVLNTKNTVNNSPSFTGFSPDKLSGAVQGVGGVLNSFYTKHFMQKVLEINNFSKFLTQTDELIGKDFIKTRVEDFQKLYGEKSSNFIKFNGDKFELYEMNPGGKLLNGLADLPGLLIDIPNAALKGAKKIPVIGKWKAWDSVSNIPLLKNRADKKAAMNIFYRLKGMTLLHENPGALRREIFAVPAGDPVANYATRDERALNRVGTGTVSIIFAGRDYFNVAMYEKNDSKEAKKAANRRMRREAGRIGLNAIITYSVLGALTTYVSKSKVFACAALAGSALFAEVVTRIASGTPLYPLTPNGAKKLNKKRAEKANRSKANSVGNSLDNPVSGNVSACGHTENAGDNSLRAYPQNRIFQNDGVFSKFNNPNTAGIRFMGETKSEIKADEKETRAEYLANKNKPFGLKHVVGAMMSILGISLAYCAARTKIPSFNKFVLDAGAFLGKVRKAVSSKDLIVKDTDLHKFLEGFDGLQSEHIKKGYSSILDVEFTREEAAELLAKARNGIIRIDKDDPIYATAFLRTALGKSTAEGIEGIKNKSVVCDDIKSVFNQKTNTEELLQLAGVNQKSIVVKQVKTQGADGGDVQNLADVIENVSGKETPEIAKAAKEAAKATEIIETETFHSNQKFQNVSFRLNLNEPSKVDNGVEFYKMKNAVFNFGRIKNTRIKAIIDAFERPVVLIKKIGNLPLNGIRKLANIEIPQGKKEKKDSGLLLPDIGEFYRDCFPMYKRYKKGTISQKEFSRYIESANTKPFNTDTAPKYSSTSLAAISRTFVTLITSYFFINDFRNEVLIQSDGENTRKAAEVTKERTAHKVSNFVLNQFFMTLFNNVFNKAYLSSLFGATAVAAATEVTNESSVRMSIGVPLRRMESREAIDEYEKKHIEQKGLKGAYYRFMARLTGKKMLSEKAENKK